jgi:peptide/nickel transport system substrate-binding protein
MWAAREEGKLRSRWAAVAVTALVGAVAACGGAAGVGNSSGSSAPISTFTYAIPAPPNTLSGFSVVSPEYVIEPLVTQPLAEVLPSGPVKPLLYTAVRQATPTSLVYTIRQGVHFSDGSTMTAADVAWSINEALNPTNSVSENIAGVQSASATGPNQVTVDLSVPNPDAPLLLSYVTVQEEKFGAAHLQNLGTPTALPIGTGPYKYESETTDAVTLAQNPYYQGTRPAPRKLVFAVIPTDASAQLAMRAGSIQATQLTNLKGAPTWKSQDNATLYANTPLCSDIMSMDTMVAPFNNVHVRQAVAYSIDRAGLLKAAFAGYATPLNALIPPGEIANNAPSLAAAQSFEKSLPSYTYDLKKAKEQVAESPYPHGFSATITYIDNTTWEQLLALSLQQAMKPLGVNITVKTETAEQWYATAFEGHTATGIQFIPACNNFAGPKDGVLYAMVGKVTEVPGTPDLANFSNPTVEQYYPAISAKDFFKYTRAQRWTATEVLLRQVASQVPYVGLWTEQDVFAVAPGYKFTQAPSNEDQLDGAWVYDIARS